MKAPVNADTLRWEVTARAQGADGAVSSDSIKVSQKVIAAVPVRTFQATILQLERSFEVPVAIPSDAIPGRGGVRVSLLKSLAGELSGVQEYMSRYPYTCFEQLVSQAVALRDSARWAGVMAALPSYLDRDGFAKYFPVLQYGSDVLTTYILTIASEAAMGCAGIVAQPDDLGAGALRAGAGAARSRVARRRTSRCARWLRCRRWRAGAARSATAILLRSPSSRICGLPRR